MRILMTTDTVGGVWTYSCELVQGLLAADESTSIFLVTFGGTPTAEQAEWVQMVRHRYGARFDCEVTSLPLEWQRENRRSYLDAEPVLRRLSKGFLPDLFHANQFCFGALPMACPKVVVAHSDVLSWFRVVRGTHVPEDSEWLRQYIELVSAGLRGAHIVVCPSAAMLADLQIGFGEQARSVVIANGRSVHAHRVAKKLQAVTAGRLWDEAKGITILEDFYSPVPILVAGEIASPEGSFDAERLRKRALLGKLSEKSTLELFAESSVYLVTSLYEPFGLAAVEAAECGCAIVTRDIASQREVWDDAAFYFRDAEELRGALARLTEDDEVLREAQGRALNRVRSRYTREHMTEGYRKLYRDLLGENVGA